MEQQDIDLMEIWMEIWQMEVHLDKCGVEIWGQISKESEQQDP